MITNLLLQILSFLFSNMAGNVYLRTATIATVCCTAQVAKGQGISYRVNNGAGTGEFVQNVNQKVLGRVDTIRFNFMTPFVRFQQIGYQRNDAQISATSAGILWTNDSGFTKRTLMADFRLPFYNITGLTDSIHRLDSLAASGQSNFGNYYDKTASDGRFYPLSTNPASYLTAASIAGKADTGNVYTKTASDAKYYLSTNPNGYITSASIAGKADTASIYTKSVSDARFQPIGSYATTTQLASKLNISDTVGMLANYQSSINTNTANILLKLNKSDTNAMLSPYLRKIDTTGKWLSPATAAAIYQPAGSYATTTQLNTKLAITDTTGKWLSPSTAAITYQPIGSYATTSQVNAKVNIVDTASMLISYLRKVDTTGKWLSPATAALLYQPTGSYATTTQVNAKVNIADTNSMLSPYLRKVDTASLSNRISTNASSISSIGTTLAGKQNLVTLTTTGSGASSFNQGTGALNIPTPVIVDSATYQTKYRSDTARTNTYNAINTNAVAISTKQNTLSLTTTGTGAATLLSSVLNIPTPTATDSTLFQTKYRSDTARTNTYNTLNGKASLAQATYTSGTGINIASNVITNTAPDQTVVLTAGNGITITGAYPNFTISSSAPTINNTPGRVLTTPFTISTTKTATVFYELALTATNPLLAGTSRAESFLEYSTNGGVSYITLPQMATSSAVGITVSLQLTSGQTGALSGIIPINALVRIRTAITGTATASLGRQQEITY